MHRPSPDPHRKGEAVCQRQALAAPESSPAASPAKPGPARRADSPVEAQGRRTLSTAFVMVGPDGHLTVERRDGRVMVLRDVVMRPRDYCGVQASGGRYCGGYAEVAAARPGGAPVSAQPDPAASPAEFTPRPAERN
jgi:hypothetical protein